MPSAAHPEPASPVGLSSVQKQMPSASGGDKFGLQGAGTHAWAWEQALETSQALPGRRLCLGRWPRAEGPWLHDPEHGALRLPCLTQAAPHACGSSMNLVRLEPVSFGSWQPVEPGPDPRKASGDCSFEEKESESWKRGQSSVTHSFAHVRNCLFTIILIFGSGAQNRLVHKFHICSCDELPSLINWKPCKALDCTWSCSLVYFEEKNIYV